MATSNTSPRRQQADRQIVDGQMPLGPSDTLVVSGGGRGVTAAVTEAIVAASGCTVILLGRSAAPAAEAAYTACCVDEMALKKALVTASTGKPDLKAINAEVSRILANRAVQQTIDRLAQHAAKVDYRSCDVGDAATVQRALANENVTALLHGAGVLRDKHLENLSADDLAVVYDTKVGGWHNLLAAVDADQPKLAGLFASSTGRFGRTGQAAYAAANAALAGAAAISAAQPQTRVLAVDWGPWDGGMVDAGLAKLFRQEGIELIPLNDSADYFARQSVMSGKAKRS